MKNESLRIYFNGLDLILDNASSVTGAVAPSNFVETPPLSIKIPLEQLPRLSLPQSVHKQEGNGEARENESFYGSRSHHFQNECIRSDHDDDDDNNYKYKHDDQDASTISKACNNCSTTGLKNAFTASVSPISKRVPATTLSSDSFSSNFNHFHSVTENACLYCGCCASPAVSHSHPRGYHADNPFVDGDGVMMEKEVVGEGQYYLEHHRQKQENRHDDYDYGTSSVSSRFCNGSGGPIRLLACW